MTLLEPDEPQLDPPAAGVRVRWEEVPERVRTLIEARLESRIVSAQSQSGGFSPGLAAVLTTADSRRLFVKAVGPEINPDSPAMYRREVMVVAALPDDAPVPRFLWSLDEGPDGWIILAFEAITGHQPRTPWQLDELDRVVKALVTLSASLTPTPVPAELVGRAERGWGLVENRWWQALADGQTGLDAWSDRHLDKLVRLQERAAGAVAGDTLLHVDLRADNLLLTGDRVVVVDWPHACIGAAWIDLAAMAPSVAMQGGPDPDELLLQHPAARAADPAAIDAFIAVLAGYMTHQSFQPDPPGIPSLRAFQRAQGATARTWLARRTGWR